MEKYKGPSIKITGKSDGSIKFSVKNAFGTEIATISAKNRRFSKIERRKNDKDKTVEVIHSAWGNDFYHEDVKYVKFSNGRKIDETYCKKEFQKKQQLRSLIRKIINTNLGAS